MAVFVSRIWVKLGFYDMKKLLLQHEVTVNIDTPQERNMVQSRPIQSQVFSGCTKCSLIGIQQVSNSFSIIAVE